MTDKRPALPLLVLLQITNEDICDKCRRIYSTTLGEHAAVHCSIPGV